jgi:hypothetical protein
LPAGKFNAMGGNEPPLNYSDELSRPLSLLGSGTYGIGEPILGSGFMFVDPNTPQPQTAVVGREGAQGAWGIAKSLAGPGASNAEINRVKNQLLEVNPELAGV